MSASRLLQPAFRAATIETAIGLLVVTGMRSGRVARLERTDVDLRTGRLRIIATKFQNYAEHTIMPRKVGPAALAQRLTEKARHNRLT